ncbi:uncharacterized protein BDZ99DRAFT_373354, partial [Mytilinidion resinicola]
VVHVRIIRKIRYYAQESGRAGRNRRKSKVIIMHGFQINKRGVIYKQDFRKDIKKEI